MVLYHNLTKHCRWKQVHSTISFDARLFFVVQISLSMLVFFLPVVIWNVLATVVIQRQAGDVVEWIPELDRAKDVVEEWKQSGLAEAMAAERPSRGKMVGVSDGSHERNYSELRLCHAFCAAKYSFFKSMRWSNCNSTFLLAQAAGTKYKISGNFIIFEIRLSKINNKTNGNSNCGQFHLRYKWKKFDAFSSLNLGRCYFSV